MATKTGRGASVFEDLSNVEFETSEDVEVIDKFKNMTLKEELLRGIFAYGERIFILSGSSITCISFRFRETFCYSTKSY